MSDIQNTKCNLILVEVFWDEVDIWLTLIERALKNIMWKNKILIFSKYEERWG